MDTVEVVVPLITNSERRDFVRCRQKWWWAFVEGLTPLSKKPALEFGDLIHECLEVRYPPGIKRGPHPREVWDEIWHTRDIDLERIWGDEEVFDDAYLLGATMLDEYVQLYGKDPDIEVIGPEFPFKVLVVDSVTGEPLCWYAGRVDILVRYRKTGKLGIVDHKTTSYYPPKQWLEMDEQATSYLAYLPEILDTIGKKVTGGEPVETIVYNFLRKAMPDERPVNELGQRLNLDGRVSKRQPSPYFWRDPVRREDVAKANLRQRIEEQSWEMQLTRDGVLRPHKNPTENCRWDCQFKDLCELHEAGAPGWEDFKDTFDTWDTSAYPRVYGGKKQ